MTGHADTIRRASKEGWGCAYGRCLNRAQQVITGKDGSQWGACKDHLRQVRRMADGQP